MITDCLQKEASKRPTAAELLKHPFFKKAKDKKYLQQTLVAIGPSLETRVQKVRLLHYEKLFFYKYQQTLLKIGKERVKRFSLN